MCRRVAPPALIRSLPCAPSDLAHNSNPNSTRVRFSSEACATHHATILRFAARVARLPLSPENRRCAWEFAPESCRAARNLVQVGKGLKHGPGALANYLANHLR